MVTTAHVESNEVVVQKEHEQWWELNVLNKLGKFANWLGDTDADSRVKMRSYIKSQGYKSVLDVPCGLCTEYFGYIETGMDIDYCGLDITKALVERGKSLNVPVKQGSIENIPFPDNSFDVCYARHILEHLDYYEKAVEELIRVASKEVIVVFFIRPHDDADSIRPGMDSGALLYHNVYNRSKIRDFATNNKKCKNASWQDINKYEVALHIYVGE